MELNWLSLLGLAVGLAMDAFAVAVAAGWPSTPSRRATCSASASTLGCSSS